MKVLLPIIITALALAALACDEELEVAEFTQVGCLDVNEDGIVNQADAADVSAIPDINGDGEANDEDAAFLHGVEIQIAQGFDRALCDGDTGETPEYAVGEGVLATDNATCDELDQPVLLVGVGGGIVNLREESGAAGVRETILAIRTAYDERGVSTQPIIAGPLVHGGQNQHGAMEDWLTNAVRVYLDSYPCMRLVLVGHSHGAVTTDVVAARLEDQYADRFVVVADIDRVDALYDGDTQSRPDTVPVFNIFENNDPTLSGAPYESPNVENWDASGETGPSEGEEGGPQEPVIHTTIDNSESVRERVVEEVMERS